MAERFAAAGARWLHVVDLDGARTGTPRTTPGDRRDRRRGGGPDAPSRSRAGSATSRPSRAALTGGAARAVIGTAALATRISPVAWSEPWGADRIAVAIDVRDGRAVGHGWSSSDTGVDAVDAVVRLAGAGVATFEVTAIAQDGLLGGPDLALYRRMVGLGIGDVIASAGIASAADLRAVRDLGCRGAIVGRALYDGTLALDEALAEGRPA